MPWGWEEAAKEEKRKAAAERKAVSRLLRHRPTCRRLSEGAARRAQSGAGEAACWHPQCILQLLR